MQCDHIEAVIFDMDGVIVDSEPLHERSFLEVWDELGYGESMVSIFPISTDVQIVSSGKHLSSNTIRTNQSKN